MVQHVLKVFGERNTGTRAVIQMTSGIPGMRRRINPVSPVENDPLSRSIATEFDGAWRRTYLHALRDDLDHRLAPDDPWKHALPRLTPGMIGAGVATILMVRNPYSWLPALARRPYHMKGPPAQSLEDFARRPWLTEKREWMPSVVSSPVDLWSRKLRAALDYQAAAFAAGLPCVMLRFEDFVSDPATTLGRALSDLGLPADRIRPLSEHTKAGAPDMSALKTYYDNETWRSDYCAGAIDAVNARIDWAAALEAGYHRLCPSDFPAALCEEAARRFRDQSAIIANSDRKAGAASAA